MLIKFDLIRADSDCFRDLYFLKSQEHDVFWSGYLNKPDEDDFKVWYDCQLKRNDRLIFLARNISNKTELLGYLYINLFEKHIELSHGVNSDKQGLGVGTCIINFATNFCLSTKNNLVVEAWIIEANVPSIRTFEKNGFRFTGRLKKSFQSSFEKEVILKNYKFESE